ncbi:MAG TPA: hypothetical protein VF487_13215 [Chitinophagaceae bacterium]
MGKKILLSQRTKDAIKRDFSKLDPKRLNKDELAYYNKVKAGKKRHKGAILFQGRYVGGDILRMAEKIAPKKGLTVQEYFNKHNDEVKRFLEGAPLGDEKSPDALIDLVSNLKSKTVRIQDDDGNIERWEKNEVIETLSLIEQFAASNTDIAFLGIPVSIRHDSSIVISLPAQDEFMYTDAELFEDVLDSFGISYIKSAGGNKKLKQKLGF